VAVAHRLAEIRFGRELGQDRRWHRIQCDWNGGLLGSYDRRIGRRRRWRLRRRHLDPERDDRCRRRLDPEQGDGFVDESRLDDGHPRQVSALQGAVADQIDDSGRAAGRLEDGLDCALGELHMIAVLTRDGKTMTHVLADFVRRERTQLATHRHTLIDLAHLRHLEMRLELGLTDEHDLQQFLTLLELGQDADFLEQAKRQVLRFVDDEEGERLQGNQRIEELVERVTQIGTRRACQAAALQIRERHNAEINEQHLEQVFTRDERIGYECRERSPIEMLEHRSNQCRLAGADFAREDDQSFAASNAGEQFFEGWRVRGAAIQKSRIGREAEGLLFQAEVRLIGQRRRRVRRQRRERKRSRVGSGR